MDEQSTSGDLLLLRAPLRTERLELLMLLLWGYPNEADLTLGSVPENDPGTLSQQ